MRYASIDILRAVAIVLMVVVHFMENLAGSDWVVAGLAAPLFTFLVGVSYRLWVLGQEARGVSEDDISIVSIRRGLFLFGLGFTFNVLVWLPEDTYNWDILTVIGVCYLLLNLVRNLPLPLLLVIAILAFALAPVLRAVLDYPSYWENGYFECDLTLPDVAIGFFVTGYFPVLPWVAFALAGFVTASLFFTEEPHDEPPAASAALIGLALIAISAVALLLRAFVPKLAAAGVLEGWSMFPPTPEYVVGTLGIVLLSFALGHRWIDRNPRIAARAGAMSVFTLFSKYSLSIYLLHHIVHLWPLWAYGAATEIEPTHYWCQAMPVWTAIALSLLFLVCCYFLFRWMDRTERPGIEQWMRRLCG